MYRTRTRLDISPASLPQDIVSGKEADNISVSVKYAMLKKPFLDLILRHVPIKRVIRLSGDILSEPLEVVVQILTRTLIICWSCHHHKTSDSSCRCFLVHYSPMKRLNGTKKSTASNASSRS